MSTDQTPTAPRSFFSRWEDVIRKMPRRARAVAPEIIGPHYEIKITRAGTDDYIHMSGFVPLDCLIADAECEAVRLGWMEQHDE